MRPELFTVPVLDYDVKSYGFMLMVGFLSAIWMAARRAEKVRADPEILINLGFCALIGGVVGARIMYVVHYWKRDFAYASRPLWAALDFSGGGMEFLGGFIGGALVCIMYLVVKRESIRLYGDIVAPSLMWGLAFGRVGCFLNGCCWGGICEGTTAEKWSVRFPFGSPAYDRQYQQRLLQDVPGPLITVNGSLLRAPSQGCGGCQDGHRLLAMESPDGWTKARRRYEKLRADHDYYAKLEPDSPGTRRLKEELEAAQKQAEQERLNYQFIESNLESYPSRVFPGQTMTPGELIDLARERHSRAVHPTQIYAVVNNLLGALFLSMLFRVRRRHGAVFATFLMIYAVGRILLEMIRVDNPQDSFGLTISQFLSVLIFAAGAVTAAVIRRLPVQSPWAREWTPPVST